MIKTLTTILISSLVLFSCHTTKPKQPITPEQIVSRMQAKYPGYAVTELRSGKQLYEQHCGNCHDLKKPESLNEEQWKNIVPPMCDKVNENKKVLGSKEQNEILKYLISMRTIGNQ